MNDMYAPASTKEMIERNARVIMRTAFWIAQEIENFDYATGDPDWLEKREQAFLEQCANMDYWFSRASQLKYGESLYTAHVTS